MQKGAHFLLVIRKTVTKKRNTSHHITEGKKVFCVVTLSYQQRGDKLLKTPPDITQ